MENQDFEISEDEPSPEELVLQACHKVFYAGIFLIRNGYGRLGILPYASPSGGAWRCEFHQLGRPSKVLFRYTSANGFNFLANHCGGSIRKDVGVKKLAQAIMVSVPDELRESSEGQPSIETLRWLDQVETCLQEGYIPQAFHEFTTDFSRWELIRLDGRPHASMSPQPGYVQPGHEQSVLNEPFWEHAERRFQSMVGSPFITIPTAALNDDGNCFALAAKVSQAMHDVEGFEAMRVLKSLVGELTQYEPSESWPTAEVDGSISLVAPSDPVIRRASRLLSMVHELHKAGYQRLRICAGLSYDKSHWRCVLVTADNVLDNGWLPLNTGSCVVYSTDKAASYFGWEDAREDGARALAAKFIERFPEMARNAFGMDWSYAGWFSAILGAAEKGRLPVFYEGLRDDFVGDTIAPPSSLFRIRDTKSGTGHRLIENKSLKTDDLPSRDANYEEMAAFCLTFDGYAWSSLTGADCEQIADEAGRKGLQNCSLNELRVTAFIRQRAAKNGDLWPPPRRLVDSMRAAIDEIRGRLTK